MQRLRWAMLAAMVAVTFLAGCPENQPPPRRDNPPTIDMKRVDPAKIPTETGGTGGATP